MSKIGRKIIKIPEGTSVDLKDGVLKVNGKNGELEVPIHPKVKIEINGDEIKVLRISDEKIAKSAHGLTRSLIFNAIVGSKDGFEKQLEIVGVGYRAVLEEGVLKLKVGFSHEVNIVTPEGITFEVKKNIISIKGRDKQQVGQIAANIREIRKPEPYKGKGIKYVGEKILRKVGKAVKGSAGA